MTASVRRVLVLGVLVALAPAAARATTLGFDDVTGDTNAQVPDGYGGLDWDNFWVLDAEAYGLVPSGYASGVVSPTYVAVNASGMPAGLGVSSPERFDFNGAYLTGAWQDDLGIRVQGYRDGALVYDETVYAGAFHPTWFRFDFLDVDRLRFTSFGGTDAGYGIGMGEHFAMDDFTFNETAAIPEPATAAGLALAACALGTYLRRRR
jgi:hypothetical protein